MEGGCGIAEAAGYGAGRRVNGERGCGAPGPGDMPQEDNRPYGRRCFAIALGGV